MVNEWTRDDLPGVHWPGIHGEPERRGAEKALDAVVEHLNAHHPKPSGPFAVMLEGTHRAQRERDAAVARADQLRDERDDAVQSCMAVGRERDEWRARAEAAEARTAPAVTRSDIEKALDTGIRGTTDGGLIDQDTSIPSGECVRLAVDAVCDLLGIEAGQATDPLLDKAREYLTVMFDYEEPDSASPAEWKAATQMARHVLGQEAKR